MGNNPLIKATGVGTILQVVMVVVGHYMPSLMDAGLFPIGGTAIGGLTGVVAALWQKGVPMGKSVGTGAAAGGIAGVLGTVVSVLLGDVSAGTVAIAGASTVGAGAIGALIGRVLGKGGASARA